MLESIKALFKREKQENKPKTPLKPETAIKRNDLTVFAEPEGQGRWTLVLGSEGQGKTHLVKTLAQKYPQFAYVEAKEFQPVDNVDLFIIDDLHEAPTSKLDEIFKYLTRGRHHNVKNIVCVSQELKGIPSQVIRRFKVIVFFYSAKQHMKMQSIVKGGLREASELANSIIRLLPRTYFLFDVQTGFFKNPALDNEDLALLMKAMSKPLPYVKPKRTPDKNGKITLENGVKVQREDIKITPLIIKTLKEHPEYKYAFVAEQFNTSEAYVKKVASRWRRGLMKYN